MPEFLPDLLTQMFYVYCTGTIETSIGVNRSHCYAMLNDYMVTNVSEYPWKIGELNISK